MDRKFSAAEQGQFERDGYLILSDYFSAAQVDLVSAARERTLCQRAMEVVVDDVGQGERTLWGLLRHSDAPQLKISDLYLINEEVRAMALDPALSELLRALLGGHRPSLCNSLTLATGSSQSMHIDSLFMTPWTEHHLVATWIAFEDVDPDAGPLQYYPGSHRIPLYQFRDGARHPSSEQEMALWHDYILAEVKKRGLKKETFLARKGDVFIWHSDLLHGGAAIKDTTKTRRSFVFHYFTEEDTKKYQQRFPDWQLVELNGGFWIDRLPQPVVGIDPKRFDAAHPFPEQSYLRRYSDLAQALREGRIVSGFAHYCAHGYAEGRTI